jgi:putative PIG3 family NAD(P)H quinone oxidoreductase
MNTGGANDLLIAQMPVPTLLANHILIKVSCFGINRADTLQRQGKYPAPPGESKVLGLEVSGEVVQVHEQQDTNCKFKLGDKVFALVAGGGYAEYVAVFSQHVMSVPQGVNMSQAAGIAECFLTAYQVLFVENNLQPSQHVLIHAGASGVGLAAIQLAKSQQCSVAVTSSSDTKLAMCESMGAELLVNYKQQDFYSEISKHWPGCDLIIDFVAGDYLNRNLRLLNRDGSLIYLAMLAGRYADTLDMAMLLGKRASIKGSTLRNRTDQYKTRLIKAFSDNCLAQFVQGNFISVIDTEYSADEVGVAHQRLENNDTIGKLVCHW